MGWLGDGWGCLGNGGVVLGWSGGRVVGWLGVVGGGWGRAYFQPSWMSAITQNHKKNAISLKSMIGTCNKNQTPLSLGQSTTSTCC